MGRVAGGGGGGVTGTTCTICCATYSWAGQRHDVYYMNFVALITAGWPETRRVLYEFCCANYSWAGQRHDVYYMNFVALITAGLARDTTCTIACRGGYTYSQGGGL